MHHPFYVCHIVAYNTFGLMKLGGNVESCILHKEDSIPCYDVKMPAMEWDGHNLVKLVKLCIDSFAKFHTVINYNLVKIDFIYSNIVVVF